MAEITSLVITKRTANGWSMVASDAPGVTRAASVYAGNLDNNDYITIKTGTGATIYNRVRYDYIDYYDTLDSDNNLLNPSSGIEMFFHLKLQGFFVDGIIETGGGGVDTLKQLLDVNIATFTGRNGQILVIDNNGQFVITKPYSPITTFQSLTNVPDIMPPGKLLMSSTITGIALPGQPQQAIGVVFVDTIDYINRPPAFDEVYIVHKGYSIQDGILVPNEEQFAKEVGDFISFIKQDSVSGRVYKYSLARWNGGDPTLLESYAWNDRIELSIPGEPGYTP